MNTFDFIPNNTERTTADMNIVALFLKAFYACRRYKDRGYYGPDMLTPSGELISFQPFNSDCNKVDLKPCDVSEAFAILKRKGYYISVWTSERGLTREYTLETSMDDRKRYV